MHFHFDFSAVQILWTLKFASVLVLLVVLIGRDRARRFPWFTASIGLMALLLLTEELLLGRISQLSGTLIYLALSDIDVVVSVLVVVELARRVFRGAAPLAWAIGPLVLAAVGVTVMLLWGPWPAWKMFTANSELSRIRLMYLVVDRGSLLIGVIVIELGLLVVLLGRRFKAGWRSHPQQIVIGLSTASLSLIARNAAIRAIGTHTQIHTMAERERAVALFDKLVHANDVVYLCVLVWWIIWLWLDEPGAALAAAVPEEVLPNAESEADPLEAPAAQAGSAPPEAEASNAESSEADQP
ncbi:MAG: hypothetical protein ABSF23_10880 [Terracidiphilus sp.]|jgi:hypothetical protein